MVHVLQMPNFAIGDYQSSVNREVLGFFELYNLNKGERTFALQQRRALSMWQDVMYLSTLV